MVLLQVGLPIPALSGALKNGKFIENLTFGLLALRIGRVTIMDNCIQKISLEHHMLLAINGTIGMEVIGRHQVIQMISLFSVLVCMFS